MQNVTLHSVQSKDGTTIGYRQLGKGPGLVICHGGGRISQNYEKLGQTLAKNFTVYIPDRRGRGLSGSANENYDMQKAVEDLEAVIAATQAPFIFGHSAGGLITLETALLFPLKKIAVYEAPVSGVFSIPSAWLPAFEKAIEKKQFKKAMAISLKGLKVMEGIEKMPFWVVLLLINVISVLERKKEKGTKMLELLPTLVPDMKMAMQLDGKQARYAAISVPVFLLHGSKSPLYFREGMRALTKYISQATLKTMEGFDHYSPEEKTEELAKELIAFFN